MKKPFQFKLPNNEVVKIYSEVELIDIGLTPDELTRRKQHLARHWLGQSGVERDWRNAEYLATDYMLLPHSRFKGEVLAGSTKLDDIIAYRDELHLYEYATEQPRPIRPLWFKEHR